MQLKLQPPISLFSTHSTVTFNAKLKKNVEKINCKFLLTKMCMNKKIMNEKLIIKSKNKTKERKKRNLKKN